MDLVVKCKRLEQRASEERQKYDWVQEYKRNHSICQSCGDDCSVLPLVFLHFDHIDPTTKIDSISNMVETPKYTIVDIEAEVLKCQVICGHCHRILTFDQLKKGIIQTRNINANNNKTD